MRRIVFAMFLVMVSIPLFATGIQQETEAQPRSVTVAVTSLPGMLEPGATISVNMYRISFNMFDTLIKNDFQGGRGLMPALAESWEYVDPRILEVRLRRGVTFHDGSAFTASDVAKTFSDERLMGESPAVETPSPKGYWSEFERVEIVDDYTVRFHSSSPNGVVPQLLSMPVYQIISAEAYEAAGDFATWAQRPVGTGPYRIAEWVPEERLRLEANEAYWGGAPELDAVTFVVVPEQSGRIAGLIAGDYDIIEGVSPDSFPLIESTRGFEVVGGPIENSLVVLFNLRKSYMDKALRQAMSLAVDRQLIVDGLWGGLTSVPNGFQSTAHGELYITDHPVPAYDPARARALVAQSVYNGEPIPYHILNNYYTNEVDTAQLLVEMWKAIGVNVEITVMENFTQVNQAVDGVRLYGMRNTSSTALYPDPVSYIWRINQPSGTVGRANGWAELAPGAAEFNELGPRLVAENSVAERRRIVARMLEIYDEDPPGIILHDNAVFYGARQGLGYTPQQQYYMDFGPMFYDGFQN
ncbi:MAG: ABC transporter substrate-binding protein [Spirochaetota bacterium]